MKKLFAVSLAAMFLFSACQSEMEIPVGTYYGTIPCADCPGINYEVTLYKDSTFIERTFYLERDQTANEISGSFKVEDDKIILLNTGRDAMNQFLILENRLQMLDKEGKPIESPLSEYYFIRPEKPKNFIMNENTNVGFKATGNEPFWVVEFDYYNRIHFRALLEEEVLMNVPFVEPVRPADTDAVTYISETESGKLEVMITREKCTDTMSGDEFDYSVRVKFKTGDMQEFRELTGCGRYLGDYRLNDIWLLQEINGEKINSESMRKSPTIEFHLAENRVFGFSGCNTFRGPLELQSDSIKLGPLASTMMACPEMELEQKYLSALSESVLHFEFGRNELILSNDDATITYKKID